MSIRNDTEKVEKVSKGNGCPPRCSPACRRRIQGTGPGPQNHSLLCGPSTFQTGAGVLLRGRALGLVRKLGHGDGARWKPDGASRHGQREEAFDPF